MGTAAASTPGASSEHRLPRAHGAGARFYPLPHVHAAGAPEGDRRSLLRIRARLYLRLRPFLCRCSHVRARGEPSLVNSLEGHRARPAAPLPCSQG
ncbi:hypothetical protein FGB62_216g026 [Gracilaria domingensis]|nr:hypothetical protein FGB62_216g026 [Gracilaria domingensis]